MKRPALVRPVERRPDEARILPLINVVFLLLIFVMVSSSLTNNDPFNTVPPESSSESGVEPARSLLVIAADGRLALNGEELNLDVVSERLAAMAKTKADPRIQVQADGESDSTRVIGVLSRLRDIGIPRVTLITMRAP